MKSLSEQLQFYQSQHVKRATRITHYLGIPMIILGVLIGLQWLQLSIAQSFTFPINWLLVITMGAYYLYLDWQVAGATFALLIPPFLLITWLTPWAPTFASLIAFAVLFGGGWALQFIGHLVEKNRPAFLQNFMQLFIAPVFLFVELMQSTFIQGIWPAYSEHIKQRVGLASFKDAEF